MSLPDSVEMSIWNDSGSKEPTNNDTNASREIGNHSASPLSIHIQDAAAMSRIDSPQHEARLSAGVVRHSPDGAVLIDKVSDSPSVRPTEADNLTCAFTFLSKLSVKELRQIVRDWNLRQAGNKSMLVARAFLDVKKAMLDNKSLSAVFGGQSVTARYESWINHQITLDRRSPRHWNRVPNESELISKLDPKEADIYSREVQSISRIKDGLQPIPDRNQRALESDQPLRGDEIALGRHEQDIVGIRGETSSFSIYEFARLCMIMRDDEDAKAPFGGIGQELNRSQLDAGFTRESYWGILEERFNDRNVKLHLNMARNLDDLDFKLPPPALRSARFLKDKFFEVRSSFTTCWDNWSKSGHNNNKGFDRFAGYRNGSLTAAGKRHMVLFVCARIGTAHEDTSFSSMCTRMIPFNRGCDEGGNASDIPSSHRQSLSSKRKPSNNDESPFERSMMEYSSFSIGYKREKANERKERAARKRRKETENQLREEVKEKTLLVKHMAALHNQMVSSGLDPGDTYQECDKQFMEELNVRFKKQRAPDQE